jgi:uncharacterized protein YraI
MQKKAFSLAVGALLLSAGAVSAATVTDNLNLRSGPSISYNVIGAMPAGSDVRVLSCGRSWCRVAFNDTTGFASRRFISSGGPIFAASPSTGFVAPSYDYGYGYAQTQSSSWAPNPSFGYGGWGYSRYYGYR